MSRANQKARRRISDLALVLGRHPFGEADLMLTLSVRSLGVATVSARGARRAQSKLGVLEPLHTLSISLDWVEHSEIGALVEAKVHTPRVGLLESSERLAGASVLLRLVRALSPPLAADPEAFDALGRMLDELSSTEPEKVPQVSARAALSLLSRLGFPTELEACARCGTPCPRASASYVDPSVGGLICRACGGGPLRLSGAERAALIAFLVGETQELSTSLTRFLAHFVESVLRLRSA